MRELNEDEEKVFCFMAGCRTRAKPSPHRIAANVGLHVDHVWIIIKALKEMGRLHNYDCWE